MAARDRDRKIVIVRKKSTRGQQAHSGSWKVAYADFVTALMAFFLVMWIVSMDSNVKDLIEGYFSNPVGFKKAFGSGQNVLAVGNTPVDSEIRRINLVSREAQRQRFEEISVEILERLAEISAAIDVSAQVEIALTDEGLRIELVDADEGVIFFDRGSDRPRPIAEQVFAAIARTLTRIENDLMIEGHTDAARYGTRNYTNWELSVARANAARRALEAGGLAPHRILEVRGYADRQLRVPDDPYHAANRRVSIMIPFKNPSPALLRAIIERRLPVETD